MAQHGTSLFSHNHSKQVSVLNKHIVYCWRAGKPRPYGGSAPLGNPKI